MPSMSSIPPIASPLSTPIQLYLGQIQPLVNSGRPSAMVKQLTHLPINLTPLGFVGDEQADKNVHGGVDKAVHYFPAEHYHTLAHAFADYQDKLAAGLLGENLSGQGLTESNVFLGDVFTLGTARLQVSQPRQPCWKIDTRVGEDGVAGFIAETGCTGWYFRVLQAGVVQSGDVLCHESRPAGAIALAELWTGWQRLRPSLDELQGWQQLPGLSANWQKKIAQRLDYLRKNLSNNTGKPQ